MVLKKKVDVEPEPEPKPFNPPKIVKTDAHCVHEGCYELKASGQTHVCTKHVRAG